MMLDGRHVKKFFGNKLVLDDVSLTLDAGECLGVVGLSGCDKFTLARQPYTRELIKAASL